MASSANPAKPISSYQERLITLQVGNRRYCVPYEPLCAISTVFLDHPQAFSQGTYEAGWDGRLLETVTRLCHVDVDGELFKHVIDLACHKKYPLFYEEKTGFDVGRHARNSKSLRAHYTKAFEKVVKVEHVFEKMPVKHLIDQQHRKTHGDKYLEIKLFAGAEGEPFALVTSKKITINYDALNSA